MRELEGRLNDPWRVTAIGVAGGALIAAFYWLGLGCSWSSGLECMRRPSRLLWIVITVDVLYGYVVGAAGWKAWVLARRVSAWSVEGVLTIRPFHPDGCAGLAAIGRLFLFLSLILAPIGLFCAGWIVFAHWPFRSAAAEPLEPWLGGGLIAVMVLGVFAFAAPMLSVHRRMAEHARGARARGAALAVAIAELEDVLLSRDTELMTEQVEPQLRQLKTLRDVYAQRQRIPTWPVDLRTFRTFAVSLVVQGVGLASTATGLADKAMGLAAKLKGWLP